LFKAEFSYIEIGPIDNMPSGVYIQDGGRTPRKRGRYLGNDSPMDPGEERLKYLLTLVAKNNDFNLASKFF